MDNIEGFLDGLSPVTLGILGTLFTWFVTALGAAVVFIVPDTLSESLERKVLDASLGFSGGIMLAASFWSLLAPAIELSEDMLLEGESKALAFFPPTIGFVVGCMVVHLSEMFLPEPDLNEIAQENEKAETVKFLSVSKAAENQEQNCSELRKRTAATVKKTEQMANSDKVSTDDAKISSHKALGLTATQRIMLLVIAMTIHNFPEGLAVGVAFGSVPSGKTTLQQAILLTIGIGLQNFPEGLAVSLPLQRQYKANRDGSRGSLFSLKWKAFLYGQLSGSVEIIGGFLGAYMVELSSLCLPYALGFAAGAMIFVVIDSIIPESHSHGNRIYASWGGIVGFVIMMVMDVALG